MRRLLALGLMLALAGCATVDPYASDPIAGHLRRDDDVGYCARLFADLDQQVDRAGVRDAEAPRIGGFPYLRVPRFSAALGARAVDGARAGRGWHGSRNSTTTAAPPNWRTPDCRATTSRARPPGSRPTTAASSR